MKHDNRQKKGRGDHNGGICYNNLVLSCLHFQSQDRKTNYVKVDYHFHDINRPFLVSKIPFNSGKRPTRMIVDTRDT